MTPETPIPASGKRLPWRCYHCNEVFTDDRYARLHFGRDEDCETACRIKGGAEQGLLGALRDAEYAAAEAQQALANECTDSAKAYYAQMTRHNQALRNAEELGYERGVADARAENLATRPPEPQTAGEGMAMRALRLVAEHASVMARLEPDAHDAILAALSEPSASTTAREAEGAWLTKRIAEVVEDDGGCWSACSGCQESCDGYVSERDYPYSKMFRCQPGGGCHECGGIGVLWQDGAFLASYGDAFSDPAQPATGTDEGAIRKFVEDVANLAGHELDAHASVELRDAARAALSTDVTQHGGMEEQEAATSADPAFPERPRV